MNRYNELITLILPVRFINSILYSSQWYQIGIRIILQWNEETAIHDDKKLACYTY